ncbi:MAG: HAD family hydrolase [Patescibacteria group bacterium]|nr:HAD family hydrolase [Patescibacteria group bacterium]
MKKKNVIFDVDGVLLWSTMVGINTLIKAISMCGLRQPSFDELRLMWGYRLEAELIPLLAKKLNWPDGSNQKVINLFLDLSYDVTYDHQPGLIKSLESLVERGYQLGIVTNRDAEGLIWRLEQQGISMDLFRHIQTPDKGFSKPDPRAFHYFWQNLNFKPDETLYVGDSIAHDLEVARRHDPTLSFAGITSGLHTYSEFVQAGVSKACIFKNVLGLTAILPKI